MSNNEDNSGTGMDMDFDPLINLNCALYDSKIEEISSWENWYKANIPHILSRRGKFLSCK